jgi:hypothetical protein
MGLIEMLSNPHVDRLHSLPESALFGLIPGYSSVRSMESDSLLLTEVVEGEQSLGSECDR